MQVSFTSISNPCHITLRSAIDQNEKCNAFSVIVKDDRFGNDYTDFKKALKSNQNVNYFSDTNEHLVSIMVNTKTDEDTLINKYTFRLNGIELPINDSTLPIFSFLAKITKTVKNTDEKNIIVNNDYIYSEELRYGLIPRFDLENFLKTQTDDDTDYKRTIEELRHPKNAKAGAEIINNSILEAMMDYFA